MPGMSWTVRESWPACRSAAHTASLLPMLQKPKAISLQKAQLEELGWQKGRLLHPHPADARPWGTAAPRSSGTAAGPTGCGSVPRHPPHTAPPAAGGSA